MRAWTLGALCGAVGAVVTGFHPAIVLLAFVTSVILGIIIHEVFA